MLRRQSKSATTARTFAAMQDPRFRAFFWPQTFSAIGEWMQAPAVNVYVLRLTHSAPDVGAIYALLFVPTVLLAPWMGAICDTFDRRRILIACNVASALPPLVIAVAASTERLSMPVLWLSVAASGVLNALNTPARQSFIAQLAPMESLANAMYLYSTSMTAARAAGPLAAALCLATVGEAPSFYANAASYIPLVLALIGLRRGWSPAPQMSGRRQPALQSMMETLAAPQLRRSILLTAAISGFGVTSSVILPVFVERQLGGSGSTYAWLAGVVGVGALFGTLAMARRARTGNGLVAALAVALGAALLLTAAARSPAEAVVPLLASGVLAAASLATAGATLQILAPPERRGRVMSAYAVAFTGGGAIVMPIMGVVAGATSARIAYILCAILVSSLGGVAVIARGRQVFEAPDVSG